MVSRRPITVKVGNLLFLNCVNWVLIRVFPVPSPPPTSPPIALACGVARAKLISTQLAHATRLYARAYPFTLPCAHSAYAEFQLLHSPAAFHQERIAWRAVIYLNLVRSVRRCVVCLFPYRVRVALIIYPSQNSGRDLGRIR